MSATAGVLEPVAPTEREARLAEESSRTLSPYVQDTEEQTIRVVPEGGRPEEAVTIPRLLSACWSTS